MDFGQELGRVLHSQVEEDEGRGSVTNVSFCRNRTRGPPIDVLRGVPRVAYHGQHVAARDPA